MESKKERMSVYVTPEMKDKIMQKCDELGIGVSALIVVALDDYFKQSSVVDMASMFKELEKRFGGNY